MERFSDTAVSFDQLRREPDAQIAASAGLSLVTLLLVVAFATAIACLGLSADPAASAWM